METPPAATAGREVIDNEHVRLLGIFHLVMAGMNFFSLVVIGAQGLFMRTMLNSPAFTTPRNGRPPPEFFGRFLTWFLIGLSLWILLHTVTNVISGICLLKRRARVFSLVAAALNALSIPFGTVLCVFTFLVLLRDSVRHLYSGTHAPTIPSPNP